MSFAQASGRISDGGGGGRPSPSPRQHLLSFIPDAVKPLN